MIDKVSNIRKNLGALPTDPVVYQWWFPCVPITIAHLLDMSKIVTKNIDGKLYYLLYVGIGVNCKERFSWHIKQCHTTSSVYSGYLSTLRQTISALLGLDMSKSEKQVNDYLDQCYLEWDYYSLTKARLEAEETRRLKNGYFPLNIQKNMSVSKVLLSELKKLRKEYRK